jgi:hypothetical protein
MHNGGRHGGEAHQHAAWRLPQVALAGLTLMMPGELATACSGSPRFRCRRAQPHTRGRARNWPTAGACGRMGYPAPRP